MIKIRNGVLSDVNELHILLNTVNELRDFEGGEEYPKSWVKNLLLHKKDNLVLIAYQDKELVGFLIAHLLGNIKDVILNNIYVKPKYRKKGVATRLLKKYEFDIKKLGMKFIMGMSRISNKKMQRFNEKYGYKKGDKFYFYYKWLK